MFPDKKQDKVLSRSNPDNNPGCGGDKEDRKSVDENQLDSSTDLIKRRILKIPHVTRSNTEVHSENMTLTAPLKNQNFEMEKKSDLSVKKNKNLTPRDLEIMNFFTSTEWQTEQVHKSVVVNVSDKRKVYSNQDNVYKKSNNVEVEPYYQIGDLSRDIDDDQISINKNENDPIDEESDVGLQSDRESLEDDEESLEDDEQSLEDYDEYWCEEEEEYEMYEEWSEEYSSMTETSSINSSIDESVVSESTSISIGSQTTTQQTFETNEDYEILDNILSDFVKMFLELKDEHCPNVSSSQNMVNVDEDYYETEHSMTKKKSKVSLFSTESSYGKNLTVLDIYKLAINHLDNLSDNHNPEDSSSSDVTWLTTNTMVMAQTACPKIPRKRKSRKTQRRLTAIDSKIIILKKMMYEAMKISLGHVLVQGIMNSNMRAHDPLRELGQWLLVQASAKDFLKKST